MDAVKIKEMNRELANGPTLVEGTTNGGGDELSDTPPPLVNWKTMNDSLAVIDDGVRLNNVINRSMQNGSESPIENGTVPVRPNSHNAEHTYDDHFTNGDADSHKSDLEGNTPVMNGSHNGTETPPSHEREIPRRDSTTDVVLPLSSPEGHPLASPTKKDDDSISENQFVSRVWVEWKDKEGLVHRMDQDETDDAFMEEKVRKANSFRAKKRSSFKQKQYRSTSTNTDDGDIEIGNITPVAPRSLQRTGSRRKRAHTLSESSSNDVSVCPSFTPSIVNESHLAKTLDVIHDGETYTPHQKGPDHVIQTENVSAWIRDAPVKLRMSSSGVGASKPLSVPSLLEQAALEYPERIAMAVKRDGEWFHWTYTDYLQETRIVAKAFIKLGLEPFNGVSILGFNSPEWFLSNLGAIFAGGLAVGIYSTNNAEACRFVLEKSASYICVVENDVQLKKILSVRDTLPHLKTIIQYTGVPEAEGVLSWTELLDIGSGVDDIVLTRRLRAQAVNQCCTLIYTSGTTGDPKGVMLSHDNLTYTARICSHTYKLKGASEAVVSYLPLSHVAAQIVDLYCPIIIGASTYFAQPDALKGSLVNTLHEVHPTVFFGVPRVWEKFYDGVQEVRSGMSSFRKGLLTWAQKKSLQYYLRRMKTGDDSVPFTLQLADKYILKKVRVRLGLEQTIMAGTGAAPISREVLEFFYSIGLPVMELFGMSECSGPHTANSIYAYHIGSAGKILDSSVVKIVDPDPEGNGELCMSGRNVFMGYLDQEEKTKEALDADGLLHSGDVAMKSDKDFVFITGRIKELIITAGGENVAPVPLEDNIKLELPFLSNVMVIGDRKKFLSVLLSVKTKMNDDLWPSEAVLPSVTDWCLAKGCPGITTVPQFINKLDVLGKFVDEGIGRANKKAVSNAQKIQKWAFLSQDFSIPGGELGPTLKLKRNVAAKKHEEMIEAFYEGC